MKNSDKIRAQFEESFPVPEGMRWYPEIGTAGDYILCGDCCCSSEVATAYHCRWESWWTCRATLRVINPFPPEMGDPDSLWAREVAEKSLRDQGLKVIG
jgi:hypothetical protein